MVIIAIGIFGVVLGIVLLFLGVFQPRGYFTSESISYQFNSKIFGKSGLDKPKRVKFLEWHWDEPAGDNAKESGYFTGNHALEEFKKCDEAYQENH